MFRGGDLNKGEPTQNILRQENISEIFAPDPRLSGLGFRAWTDGSSSSKDLEKLFEENCAEPGSYKQMRHMQVRLVCRINRINPFLKVLTFF